MTKPMAFLAGALLSAVALGAGFWAYRKWNGRSPQLTYDLPDDILVHGNVELKEVAFTFDDGPRPEVARPLLDLLGKEHVKATFFVVGEKVEENPALVRRMIDEGHEVGNHSYSHPRLDGMSGDQIRQEIAQCAHAVEKAAGVGMNLFRPPGMRYDAVVIRTAQDLGYVTIHWNSAAQDFKPKSPDDIVDKILKRTQPGSVILLHSHPDTIKALPKIFAGLREKGYRFVRVSQMLARLPRPVYVRTNAYEPTAIADRSPADPPKRTNPKRAEPSEAHSPKPDSEPHRGPKPRKGVDVPSWG